MLGKINSSLDAFLSDGESENRDKGSLVEWTPFLETDVDLSYDWVIPNVLERQERVIVVAAEGAGKTTLARQVALMSASGIHPFRRDAMKPARTLMIDLENPERIIEEPQCASTTRSSGTTSTVHGRTPPHEARRCKR